MAREDIREKLAKQPLGTKLALLAGSLLVVGLGYWQFSFSPLKKDVQAAETRHDQLVSDNRRLVQREREYAQLIERRDELEDKLRESLVSLPVAAELPAFFVHLQRQASAAGVRVQKWSRRDERPVADYLKVPVEMQIQGTFHQIMHYFKLVYETDRVITIENFSLGSPRVGDDDLVLSAEFTAATFRQAGDGAFAELGLDPRAEEDDGGDEPAEDVSAPADDDDAAAADDQDEEAE
jgi:type IV pilus assembly protein PilO